MTKEEFTLISDHAYVRMAREAIRQIRPARNQALRIEVSRLLETWEAEIFEKIYDSMNDEERPDTWRGYK